MFLPSRRQQVDQISPSEVPTLSQLRNEAYREATYICLYDWLSNSSDPNMKIRAADMKDTARSILNLMSESERKLLNNKFLATVRPHLDKLSSQWSALQIGQYMTVEWSHQK